jgi:asparagine synthase (glutamine-hydrolysing)
MTWPGLAAVLPRGATLLEPAQTRFREAACELGLTTHRLACGAVVAVAGAVAVEANAVAAGEIFSDDGRCVPLERLCAGLDQRGHVPADRSLWGDYLTITGAVDGSAIQIVRSAFGNLPCFWMTNESHVLVATSAKLLRAFAQCRPAIDWRQLALFLLSPQMRTAATCLQGVEELPAGSMLQIAGHGVVIRPQWSPWVFARPCDPLETLEDAAAAMGEAVDRAVQARCASVTNPVLLLSGGLDSAVIAASLRAADRQFSALTMVTRHRSGDERVYARAAAATFGAHLTECFRSTAAIDWFDPTPHRLVRPAARIFRQPTIGAAHRHSREISADTIIDGGGGDDVFCSLRSVAPLLDRYATEGFARGVWRTACDIALRADVDVMTVFSAAARRLARRSAAFRWPTVTAFLTEDAAALAAVAVVHPWLEPPPGTLPGQAAHVALVLDSLSLSEDDSMDPAMRTLSPLVAQPVVETALRVRSWLWFLGGRDRAVIRQAFARRLPATIIERTGKGTPTGFMAEIVEAHRAQLRTMLCEGLLAAHGIADPVAIESALSASSIARGDQYAQLLVVADAERWARLWC